MRYICVHLLNSIFAKLKELKNKNDIITSFGRTKNVKDFFLDKNLLEIDIFKGKNENKYSEILI